MELVQIPGANKLHVLQFIQKKKSCRLWFHFNIPISDYIRIQSYTSLGNLIWSNTLFRHKLATKSMLANLFMRAKIGIKNYFFPECSKFFFPSKHTGENSDFLRFSTMVCCCCLLKKNSWNHHILQKCVYKGQLWGMP